MHIAKHLGHVLAGGFALLMLAGCGDDRPERITVTGTTSYQNQPIEGARVTFYCEGARPASAVTDAAGRFTLGTYDLDDGAVLGTHTVTIVKTEQNEGASLANPGQMVRHLLPSPYQNPTDSPLSATVTTDGENDFTFVLVD